MSFCNFGLPSNTNLLLVGTYVTGKDSRVDPFCVWGNEIFMNQHQVKKLIKLVNKMGQNMAIKLFLYTLSKTTVNSRMVTMNSVPFFFTVHNELLAYKFTMSESFLFVVVPKAVYSRLPLKLHEWWMCKC